MLLIFYSFDVFCATQFIEPSRYVSLTSYGLMYTDSLVHGLSLLALLTSLICFDNRCSNEMFDCAQCAPLLPLTQVAFGRKRLRVEVKQEAPQRTVW